MTEQPLALGYAISLSARGFEAEAAELRRLHQEVEALRSECRTLVRQNGEWREKVEALKADAERYRHVRRDPTMLLHLSNEDFDAAIDAARSKE